jgi:hypothetical protein
MKRRDFILIWISAPLTNWFTREFYEPKADFPLRYYSADVEIPAGEVYWHGLPPMYKFKITEEPNWIMAYSKDFPQLRKG